LINELFFFKVRTNKDGGPIYGLITSPIRFDVRGTNTPYIDFKYYLNHNGTRNLEADYNKKMIAID